MPSSTLAPLPQRVWMGEQAKVVVLEFDNETISKRKRKPHVSDAVYATGMKAHLINALLETGQFAVLEHARTGRPLRPRDFPASGKVSQKILSEVGILKGVEFFIAGKVLTYQPSEDSVSAGMEADPMFGNPLMDKRGISPAALKKAFARLPVASPDRVVIHVRVIEPKNGKTISSTILEGTPQDFGQKHGGLFAPRLMQVSKPLQTPMQKALRACMIKATDWIADASLEYRRLSALVPSQRPPAPTAPIVKKKAAPAKKPGVNKQVRETQQSTLESIATAGGEKPNIKKPLPWKEEKDLEEWGQ